MRKQIRYILLIFSFVAVSIVSKSCTNNKSSYSDFQVVLLSEGKADKVLFNEEDIMYVDWEKGYYTFIDDSLNKISKTIIHKSDTFALFLNDTLITKGHFKNADLATFSYHIPTLSFIPINNENQDSGYFFTSWVKIKIQRGERNPAYPEKLRQYFESKGLLKEQVEKSKE